MKPRAFLSALFPLVAAFSLHAQDNDEGTAPPPSESVAADSASVPASGSVAPPTPPPRPLGAPTPAGSELRRFAAPSGATGAGLKKSASVAAPAPRAGKGVAAAKSTAGDSAQWLNLDYVDEPILDVLRSIATAYRLSIIPDKDLSDVKVTIHLEKIPVLEGLEKLCRSHGLELIQEGNVYRVRRQREAEQSMVQIRGGKLFLDVKNKPVRDFLREFGEKTGINIVPGQGLAGAVTGQLRNVAPLDGLKALMAANNYALRMRSGVYLVEPADSSGAQAPSFGGRRRLMPGTSSGAGEVDVHDGKVTLNCRNSALADVIREIAEESGQNYSVISDLTGTVNAQMRDVPVEEALVNILKGTRFSFVRSGGTLLIGDRNPGTPSGQALAGAELIYLKHIRAENLEKLLPKSIQPDNLRVIKEQNALLVSGTGEDIQQVKEYIDKVDLPTPQVLLEVVVVEYNRQKESELGVGAGKTANLGPNLNVEASFSGLRENFRQGSFQGSIGILAPSFDLGLRALESQNRARVMAMPKITTLNGNKAELRVTRTSYYRVSSVTKDGFQNNDYRAIDDGITIEITPWITKHGEVNVNVTPSIKTAGQATENSPAPVTNRSITTNVALKDGETIALGGLITSQTENQRRFVPILGSIPLLKYLFSYRKQLKLTTELVIYVTPHVLDPDRRGVNLGEEFRAMEQRDGAVKPADIIPGMKADSAAVLDSDKVK